ncbi:uncharacterized protein LOC132937116 [Metopolophium dirhodum]|uniref:uncharacterized protein LOC132937116 n=1 Tax=Metopolophium dirhodum TaxID=44670 RepID=UPI0029901977|nr:uncharacterized protein LOC132937116 [Metopolophium dirhodum]
MRMAQKITEKMYRATHKTKRSGFSILKSSLIDARSFAKDNSEVSSNEIYVFEENKKNRNKSIQRSSAGSSKEFIVPKLPTVSSDESEDEENPGNSCYPDASSLSQTDELFANNSPSNSVESHKKHIKYFIYILRDYSKNI